MDDIYTGNVTGMVAKDFLGLEIGTLIAIEVDRKSPFIFSVYIHDETQTYNEDVWFEGLEPDIKFRFSLEKGCVKC